MSKKQIIFFVVGLVGLYTMQKFFEYAQADAMGEKSVVAHVTIAIIGLIVALVSAVGFIYERKKDKSYSPTETLAKAYKEDLKPKPKITPAYPDDQKFVKGKK